MRFLSLLLCLLSCSLVNAQELKFVDVPVVNSQVKDRCFLADILNRCRRPELGNNRSTNAHETSHQIHSELRNAHGGRVNAFYLGNGKACIVKEPGVRISDAARFIPPALRSYRYQLYVVDQRRYWENEPLYLADEWSSYINGCQVALEDVQQKRGHSNADEASGVIELGLYTLGMAMAVEKLDPEYFKSDTQFKPFLKYQWARAKKLFDQAAPLFPSDNQVRQVKLLQESPDAAELRKFITRHLDGVWLK